MGFIEDPTLFDDKVANRTLPVGADARNYPRAADFNALKGAALDLRTEALAQAEDISNLTFGTPSANAAIVTATGSTTGRSLAARFADVVNVKDHGATGDGTTNDTTSVQAAANAAFASGAILHLPAGTYSVEKLSLNDGGDSAVGLVVQGDSAGRTTLLSRSGDTVIEITGTAAHSMSFRDFQILGPGPTTGTGHGVYIHDNDFDDHLVTFERVRISGMGGKGIYLPKTFSAKFDSLVVTNCGGTGIEGRFDVAVSFVNVFFGKVLANQYGVHCYTGTPTFVGCNGIDSSSEVGASWGKFGRNVAEDGAVYRSHPTFIGTNFEDVAGYGVRFVSGGWGSFYGCRFMAKAGALPKGISYEGTGATSLGNGVADASTFQISAGADWADGYMVHTDGDQVPLVLHNATFSTAYKDGAGTTVKIPQLYRSNTTGALRFNNGTLELAGDTVTISPSGDLVLAPAYLYVGAQIRRNGTSSLAYMGTVADGATAIAHKFGNASALNTLGGKIAAFYTDDAFSVEKFAIGRSGEGIYPTKGDSTGTPGAATINQPAGRSAIAASASSVVITNNLVSATSIVFAQLQGNDTTATYITSVVPGAGSFTVTTNAAATGNLTFAWEVKN